MVMVLMKILSSYWTKTESRSDVRFIVLRQSKLFLTPAGCVDVNECALDDTCGNNAIVEILLVHFHVLARLDTKVMESIK